MSSAWSEIFSSHLTPFTLVGESGAGLTRKENTHVTRCPGCGSDMHVLTHDLVCENDSCNLRTITGFEFLSIKSFGGDLAKTAAACSSVLRSKKVPVQVPDSEISDYYTRIRDVRKLFEVDQEQKKISYLQALADGWLRKNKLDPEIIRRVSRVWTSAEMQIYNNLVKPDSPMELGPSDFVVAIPYSASFSEVGAVLFLRDGYHKPTVHRIEPYKYMWAGLQNIRPENSTCLVTQNFSKFFQCLAGGKYQHPDYPFACMLYDGLCSRFKFIPETPVYLFDPDKDVSMASVASLYKDKPSLEIADSRKPLSGLSHQKWEAFILEECARRAMSAEGIPEILLQYIDSCKLPHSSERKLCRFLMNSGLREKSMLLDHHFSTRVIMDEDKFRIHASPSGYFARHNKTGIRTDITNFIINPRDNVAFREVRELTVRMDIAHDGSSFEVSMPVSALDVPTQFEEYIRSGWMGGSSKGTNIPIIKDRAMFRKYMSRYVKDCVSTLPCKNGVSFLGWNFKKTEFQGPGWVIRENGIMEDECVMHPDRTFLSKFDLCPWTGITSVDHSLIMLNTKCVELMSVILGSLYRGKFDYKAPSVSVSLGSKDLVKVMQAFKGLGQSSMIREQDTGMEHGNRRYLFLTESQGRVQGGGILINVVEEDFMVNIDEELLCAWILRNVVAGVQLCLREQDPWIKTRRKLDDKFVLLQEGQNLLQKITGMVSVDFDSPFSALEAALEDIRCEDIGEYIALDLERGRLAVNKDLMKGEQLVLALQQITGNDVQIDVDAYRVGMSSLSEALISFYRVSTIPYGRFVNGDFIPVV